MVWTIIAAAAVSVLLIGAVMLVILRFNQLSMARSLCDEAKRQLVVELKARHALVPAYIGTLQQVTTRELSSLELALASAERAPFGPRGAAAENALTAAIDGAALIPGTRSGPAGGADATTSVQAGMRDELETTVLLLHGQLTVLAERIVAVSRLYNANVDRYHRQRTRFLSRLFGRVFRHREHFTEEPAPVGEPHRAEADTPTAAEANGPTGRQDRTGTGTEGRTNRGAVEA